MCVSSAVPHRGIVFGLLAALTLLVPTAIAHASECDSPDANWLFCEDFEGGAAGWDTWFAQSPFTECLGCSDGNTENPDRIHLLQGAEAHDGDWALAMPATANAGYRGASLTYRSCAGDKRPGCTLEGYDQLYYRAWVKLDPDHQYVHHFMSLAGTKPDGYWDSDGNAGCRPNGERAAGTTVDFNMRNSSEHELFFYTYYPEMNCDSGGYCSGDYVQNICDGCATKNMPCSDGPECCWGNHFSSDPRPVLPRGEWVCLEMMMRLNTPGQADGEMAFWVNDTLGHRETGMHWRDISELQLNKVWVQHYIAGGDADQPNRIVWDDIIASTERIGCTAAPVPPLEPGQDVGGTDMGFVADPGASDTSGDANNRPAGDTGVAGDTTQGADQSTDTAGAGSDTQTSSNDTGGGGDVTEPPNGSGDETSGECACRAVRRSPDPSGVPVIPLAALIGGLMGLIVLRRRG